jgi:hypothetical protein
MLTTPPVKNVVDNCVDQYKNVNSVLTTPIFPTPTPALDEVQRQEKENWDKWNNRWGTRTPELMEEGYKRAMLWADMPKEWSDVLHAYYAINSRAADYAPGLHDSDKIQNTIDTLERVKRSQNNTVERENIDKIINQLNMDLMYFRIKHGK